MTDQIEHMQRLQLAGTLAGGIAHDLNNELTLILGNLDLALDQSPTGDDVCNSLEHARSAALRCADMSRQLLAISRDRRTSLTRIDVAASVIQARTLLEYIKPPKVRLSTEAETGLLILGNANQLQQALVELGTNAFDAMMQDGAQGGTLEIRAGRHEDMVEIRIHDTGCGMDAALQKRVFEPFYTTHRENGGSGLGLATVKSIVGGHDGMLGIHSEVGEGTTFVLRFPSLDEPTSLR